MEQQQPVRAAIYTRISKDAAGQRAGVRRQETACRDLAKGRGWQVVRVFTDNDTSAYSGTPRPGYDALLNAVQAGQVDVVLCWHTDRLYRRAADLERYIAVCEAAKVATHAVQSGPLDLATPSGRMVARQMGAVAAYEVEQKSERQRAANLARATAGQVRKGGTRLFGYLPDMAGIVPAEAELVRDAYAVVAHAQGSLYGIAKRWNELGVSTPQGRRRLPDDLQHAHDEALAAWEAELDSTTAKGGEPPAPPRRPHVPSRWDGPRVRQLLLNPRYAGIVTYRRQIVRDASGEPVMGSWEPLVPLDLWQAAQTSLQGRTAWPVATRQLLAGLARCGVCGEPMASGGTRNGRRRIRCSAHGGHPYREAGPIEDYVVRVVLARLQQPDAREALSRPAGQPVDTSALNDQLASLASREQDMATAFADGHVTIEQLTTATARIATQRAALEAQLPAPASPLMRELLAADDVCTVWDGLDQDRQRAVIRLLCDVEVLPARTKEHAYLDWRERVINPDSVRITWR